MFASNRYHAKIQTCGYGKKHGFILLPVVLTLTLLAVIAFMLSRQSALNTGGVVREHQSDIARYVAEAGLNHSLWQANGANCTGYTNLTNIPFGSDDYSVSIDPKNGSPISIKSVGKNVQGASHTISRDQVKVYQFPTQQLVLQPDAKTGMDNFLYQWKTTWNYGRDTKINVRNNWSGSFANSLLKFDVSSVPDKAKIISATLELWQKDVSSSGGTVGLRQTLSNWDEGNKDGAKGASSWDESVAGIAWINPGGDYSPSISASTTIPPATQGWFQWDITRLVAGWVNNAGSNKGFMLTPESPDTYVSFNSSDNPDPMLSPKLTIIYACECGKSCGAPVPVTFCEADYAPNVVVTDYSSSSIGSADAQAITYIPEGISFNGVASPAGGAWVLIDPVDTKFYMTDMAGSLLTSLTIPLSSAYGGVFINSGTYANHIALTNTSGGLVYVDMNGNNVSGTLASGSSQAAGIGFVGSSSSGTYDDHILVLDRSSETVLIRTQDGTAVSSFSVNDGTSMTVQDVTHLPGSDKVIVTYEPDKAIIYDFSGTVLREYPLKDFGVTLAESIAINPLTCDHVVADRGTDRVIALNYAETLPIAHWKLDETSGTTAVDSEGGHNGTLMNGPVWSVGKIDGGLSFDGSNDFISVPHDNTLLFTGGMTFVSWAKTLVTNGGYNAIISKDVPGNGASNYWFGIENDELVFGFWAAGSFRTVKTSAVNLTLDTWYHLAASFDNATDIVRLYVDGIEVQTGSISYEPTTETANLWIGHSVDGEYWKGKLDDVRIYNSALTAPELTKIYKTGGGAGTPSTESPVTFNPSADNRLKENSSTNYGSDVYIEVGRTNGPGRNSHSVLAFDVSIIPAGSLINSATLRLYANSRNGSKNFDLNVHQITQDWTELGSSWTEADNTTLWTAGPGGTYDTPVISSLPAASTGWYEWNIAPLVQEWVEDPPLSSNQGIIVVHKATNLAKGNTLDFSSKEGANAPQLVIDFIAP